MDLRRLTAELDARLEAADEQLVRRYPGERPERQPVHTVYVPADRYDARTVPAYGAAALAVLEDHEALLQDLGVTAEVLALVRDKLRREPVEDLRIDFEDGYGPRPDDEEDEAARTAATALREAVDRGEASAYGGIRFKSLERPTRARGIRTLGIFLETLGGLPEGFVVTLPKVTSVEQVEAMVHLAGGLEAGLGLPGRSLRFEVQVETPQSVVGPDGTALVARMLHVADGRVTGLHYGTYDYSAFCGIAAAHQSLEHPVADHAKAVMQAAAAGTGVRLSDGSTNLLPVGEESQVRLGWETHLRLVRRSLERGYYQGWDLHPHQLVTRYAATFAFYREGFGAAARRLRDYVGRHGSSVLDEPATARALADFLLRGTDCGALTGSELADATGLDTTALARLARRNEGS